MKKVLLGFLILAMFLCLAACNDSENVTITGTWQGEISGEKSVFVFNQDGSCQNFLSSQEVNGTTGTYIYFAESETLQITNEDNWTTTIDASIDGDTMTLTQQMNNGYKIDIMYKKIID